VNEQTPTLRQATNEDAAHVRELVFGVLREYGLVPDPEGTDADLGDIEAHYQQRNGRFDVLVDADGTLLGCVGLYPLDPTTIELRKMYLAPSARGRGLGRQLLQHAVREARALGFDRMTLETASVLKEAIALYRRCGFEPFDTGHTSDRCDGAMQMRLDEPEE
jgi:putative acetyltransferase